MNIERILTLISMGAGLFDTIVGIIDDVKDTLSEEDKTKLDDALKSLQAKNDETYSRVSAKLKEASKK